MSAVAFQRASERFGAVATHRDTEYNAFARVTRLLSQADPTGHGPAAKTAVHLNTELWSTLAADLAHEGNQLPDQLKASLISLAIFSIRHGVRVAAKEAKIQPLIDINISMMRGLRGDLQP